MINAITNNIRTNNIKDTDIQIYDAEQCFDKLWAKECYNDIYMIMDLYLTSYHCYTMSTKMHKLQLKPQMEYPKE